MNNRKATRAQTQNQGLQIISSKRSQVTIFIIIGIVIVAGVVLFFMFKDNLFTTSIPASIEPAYKSFLSCVEEETLVGIDLIETQAGYIELPGFEPGSEYMPFSNQLNFLGNPIPYWYYVSGNNIQSEQVPTIKNMQEELENFIEERLNGCEFDAYYDQGFEIIQGTPSAEVIIKDNSVEVDITMNLEITKGNDTSIIKSHDVVVDSRLGELYNKALEVYGLEQDTLFLEEYAVDTLRLYAPVDGVELTCSPKVWKAEEVFDELETAIVENTLALKTKDGDYTIEKEEEYFVTNVEVGEEVRFINSKEWAHGFDVSPTEGSMLIAKPVGNQPGLGVMGFCYVPYHFVYNVRYPVLIQIGDEKEMFQFPVAVVLQGNNPREALEVNGVEIGIPELCRYKNNNVEVNVYDTNLNFVEADISYECFGSSCNIGSTQGGILNEEFPQCVNGYIITTAEGYEDSKYLFSSLNEGSAEIILDRLYELNVELKKDFIPYNSEAIISFISEDTSKTIVYPDQKTVELSEGQYEVQVHAYKNSTLRLDSSVYEQCIDTPSSGIGGLFGFTEEKCFEVEIPSQIISNVLNAGGKENYYILESELADSRIVELNIESLPIPKSIEDLQNNYILFENKGVDVVFK